MSDNIQLPNSQIVAATDDVNGVQFQRVKLALGSDGVHDGDVNTFNPLPVKLDAASLAALENITVHVDNPSNAGLTDAQLRAAPLTVSVDNQYGLTNTQLRSAPIEVNVMSVETQPLPSGASTELTLAGLKTVVENLKTVIDTLNGKITEVNTNAVTVTNPTALGLTNTELRSAPLDLPTGASTESTLSALKTAIDSLNAKVTAVNTGAVTVTNPTPAGLTNTELRASEIPVADIITQSILYDMANVTDAIKDMSDSMLYMQSAILEKMGRLDRFDRMTVQVSDSGGNEINSPYYGVSLNFAGESSGGRSYSRIFEPFQFSNVGANHLYNQLTITG